MTPYPIDLRAHKQPEVLYFPFTVPGFGTIENGEAWKVFRTECQYMTDSINALYKTIAMLEIENGMLKERIENMLLLDTEMQETELA